MGLSQGQAPPIPPTMTLVSCLQKSFSLLGLLQISESKFNQRSEEVQSKGKQASQNNNSLVIKQSQGTLAPPQGIS